MTQYFITSHRTVWDGEKHVYVCDTQRFDGWCVTPVWEGAKQVETVEILGKLKAQQEEADGQ